MVSKADFSELWWFYGIINADCSRTLSHLGERAVFLCFVCVLGLWDKCGRLLSPCRILAGGSSTHNGPRVSVKKGGCAAFPLSQITLLSLKPKKRITVHPIPTSSPNPWDPCAFPILIRIRNDQALFPTDSGISSAIVVNTPFCLSTAFHLLYFFHERFLAKNFFWISEFKKEPALQTLYAATGRVCNRYSQRTVPQFSVSITCFYTGGAMDKRFYNYGVYIQWFI